MQFTMRGSQAKPSQAKPSQAKPSQAKPSPAKTVHPEFAVTIPNNSTCLFG